MNFNKKLEAVLQFGEKEDDAIFTVPHKLLVGWGLYIQAKECLDATSKKLKQRYEDCGTLESFFNNCAVIFNELVDDFVDTNLQDFIDSGKLEIKRDDFKKVYTEFSYQKLYEGLQPLTDFWFDTTLDAKQKEMYREHRKANRAQSFSIGFGFWGGVKSGVSAELGNVATGILHGAVNSVANSLGKMAAEDKLDKFYKETSTFNALLNGWEKCFWDMYDKYIEIFVLNYMSNGIGAVLTYNELMELKSGTENHYENLKRADVSQKEYISTIFSLLVDFPFNISFFSTLFQSDPFVKYRGSILEFARRIQVVDHELYAQISTVLICILIREYSEVTENTEKDSIVNFIKKELKDDFPDYFINAFRALYGNTDISYDEMTHVIELMETMNIDINELIDENDEFLKIYRRQLNSSSYDYVTSSESTFLSFLDDNNIDEIIKIEKNDNALSKSGILFALIKFIGDDNSLINENSLKFIELLNDKFNCGFDLTKNQEFTQLKKHANATKIEHQLKTDDDFREKVKYYNYLKDNFVYNAFEFKEKYKWGIFSSPIWVFIFYFILTPLLIGIPIALIVAFVSSGAFTIPALIACPVIAILVNKGRWEDYIDGREDWQKLTNKGKLDIRKLYAEYQILEKELQGLKDIDDKNDK